MYIGHTAVSIFHISELFHFNQKSPGCGHGMTENLLKGQRKDSESFKVNNRNLGEQGTQRTRRSLHGTYRKTSRLEKKRNVISEKHLPTFKPPHGKTNNLHR